MKNKDILKAFLLECIHLLDELDELDQIKSRVSRLEALNGITPNLNTASEVSNTYSQADSMPEPLEKPNMLPANVKYFNHLEENEDGEIYVSVRDIHDEPDNYEIIINDKEAEVRFSSDTGKIKDMLTKYVVFFQPCRKLNNPSNGCGVETVQPGQFKLEGERWFMESKITIKFT